MKVTLQATLLALAVLVGCGGSDIMQCHWCKEDVKKDALICKHCGKIPNPNSGTADQSPNMAPSKRSQADSVWENKTHPDQVSIREVETDKQEFLRRLTEDTKMTVIKGTISLSSYCPIDKVALPGGVRVGRMYLSKLYYAFGYLYAKAAARRTLWPLEGIL